MLTAEAGEYHIQFVSFSLSKFICFLIDPNSVQESAPDNSEFNRLPCPGSDAVSDSGSTHGPLPHLSHAVAPRGTAGDPSSLNDPFN